MSKFDPNEIVDYVIVRTDSDYDTVREIISVALEKEGATKTFLRQATRSDFLIIQNYLYQYEDSLVAIELLRPGSNSIAGRTLEQRMEDHLKRTREAEAEKERKRIAQNEAARIRNAEAKRKAEEKAISDAKNLLKKKGLI